MKLELKQIAPYLPYELKIFWHKDSLPVWDVMNMYNIDKVIAIAGKYEDEDRWKPILRPLSELTKEIEINGVKFIPVNEILRIFNKSLNHLSTDYQLKALRKFEQEVITKELPYSYISMLIEWHFDIFGLIEKGLAIDINTLKQ